LIDVTLDKILPKKESKMGVGGWWGGSSSSQVPAYCGPAAVHPPVFFFFSNLTPFRPFFIFIFVAEVCGVGWNTLSQIN
jgi:hypothetical protein